MNTKQMQGIVVGAIVAAGVVGTGVTLLLRKKEPLTWMDRIKKASSIETKAKINKTQVLTGLAASLVGLATTLLTTPQSGQQIIKTLSERWMNNTKKAALPKEHEEHHKKAPTKKRTLKAKTKLEAHSIEKPARTRKKVGKSSHVES